MKPEKIKKVLNVLYNTKWVKGEFPQIRNVEVTKVDEIRSHPDTIYHVFVKLDLYPGETISFGDLNEKLYDLMMRVLKVLGLKSDLNYVNIIIRNNDN